MGHAENRLAALVAETGNRVIVHGTDVIELTEQLMRSGYGLPSAASVAVSYVGADLGLAEAIVVGPGSRAPRVKVRIRAGSDDRDQKETHPCTRLAVATMHRLAPWIHHPMLGTP